MVAVSWGLLLGESPSLYSELRSVGLGPLPLSMHRPLGSEYARGDTSRDQDHTVQISEPDNYRPTYRKPKKEKDKPKETTQKPPGPSR